MLNETPIISMVVVGLCLASILGTIAQRFKISPIAGYLLAGIIVGPHTPGFVADQSIALELAELGVILLMFGVGLHFSLKDLLSVRAIAIPGAILQIVVSTLLGLGLAILLGWTIGAGLVFGLALSVASTVVLMRTLRERRLVNTDNGKIAVGWLIVQDIVMVFLLVLLPTVVPLLDDPTVLQRGLSMHAITQLAITLGVTFGKVAAFLALMLILGRKLIPWVLHYVAHTGSRELFRLCVLSIALGVAFGAAKMFGVSFALGAFFAGMILSESELSQRAAEETLPLRDAFAVLFFVSVGMLFNPAVIINHPWEVLATLAIIVFGQSLAACGLILLFGQPKRTALFIAASLGQIGEFSFILGGLGISLGVMSEDSRDLILAGAIISIILNPLMFYVLERVQPDVKQKQPKQPEPAEMTTMENHIVLVGYGKVGHKIGATLYNKGEALFVLDENSNALQHLNKLGIQGVHGHALTLLPVANLKKAKTLLVAVPDSFEAGQIVTKARAINPDLFIIARGHSDAESDHLKMCGANKTIVGAEEIATAMVEQCVKQ
ncbi:MAG: Kef family K(+) transporter [Alphaproteobacteria bacterium]|nr:Kef family K(+) transporter [Alphaproteobacteria bacterium]